MHFEDQGMVMLNAKFRSTAPTLASQYSLFSSSFTYITQILNTTCQLQLSFYCYRLASARTLSPAPADALSYDPDESQTLKMPRPRLIVDLGSLFPPFPLSTLPLSSLISPHVPALYLPSASICFLTLISFSL